MAEACGRTCRRPRTPACGSAPPSARPRSPAATSSPSSPSPACGRSAPGWSSWSRRAPARRAGASCRWSASRSATPGCTATTACSPTSAWRGRRDGAGPPPHGAGRRRPSRHRARDGRRLRARRRVRALGDRVATAGRVLGIDPFDQPNVQESKDTTRRLLAAYIASGELPEALTEAEGRLANPVRRRPAGGSGGIPCPGGRATTSRSWPTSPPARPRASTCRRCALVRDALASPPRSASGRASCIPPASCTRAGRTTACSCNCRARPAGVDPRLAVQLRLLARAGARRPGRAAGARPPRAAGALGDTSRRRQAAAAR